MELKSSPPSVFEQTGFSILKLLWFLLAVLIGGQATYYGWDKGYIPGNKRAVSAPAMREAIEMKINIDESRSTSACVYSDDAMSGKAERDGLPGVAFDYAPELSSKTYLTDLSGRNSGSRKRLIAEKSFLAKQGFYNQENVQLKTDKGLMNAIRFTMNMKGYLSTRPYAHSKECFSIGDRELKRITSFIKLPEKVIGQEAWKVEYETMLVNRPKWIEDSEASKIFYNIEPQAHVNEHSTILIRGENKWVLEEVAYWQVSRSQVDARNQRKLNEINKVLFFSTAPKLQKSDAEKALTAYVESSKWQSRVACLPIRLRAGGDNRLLASSQRRNRSETFSAHFFDMDMTQRKSISSMGLATELATWNALYAAGFAKIEALDKGEYKYSSDVLEDPEGLKLTLDKEVEDLLHIRSRKQCIPFGSFDVELVGFKPRKLGVYEVIALGRPKSTPKWVYPIAEQLPALKHAIEHGVLVKGWIHYEKVPSTDDNSVVTGEWRIEKLGISYPQTRHHEMPAVLQPVMPVSFNTWPRIKAPLNTQELSNKQRQVSSRHIVSSQQQRFIREKVAKQNKAKLEITNNHSVTLSSIFQRNYEKRQLNAEYTGAGAATPWLLSKNYSSGRYYFEVTGKTVGQLSFSGHANISLTEKPKRDHFGIGGVQLIKHGEHRLRADNDVFGIAIDYEKGTLFHHINGEWMTGKPGGNAGLKIKKRTEYSPVFVATGNKQGRKGVYWEVNLGRKGFIYEMPSGFKAYGS